MSGSAKSAAKSAAPKDEGLVAQLRSFNAVFWICNAMEMLERLAYYGLRTVLPVYMVLAIEDGGPQFTQIQKGVIYGWWAAIQSGIPIVSGGYADRYGYKNTVGVAIAIKIVGYLVMAYAIEIASALTGGASLNQPGHEAVYCVFMVGSLTLAAGTAIFKPGIQGILALQMNEKNASLGWSVFYQLVNVGGFLGPILAGVMRLMQWRYVFIACAVIVGLNYILLLVFPEPDSGVDKKKRSTRKLRKTLSIGTTLIASALLALSGVVERLALVEMSLTDKAITGSLILLVLALVPIGVLFFASSLSRLVQAAQGSGKSSVQGWASFSLVLTGLALASAPVLALAGVASWPTALMIAAASFALNLLGGFLFEEPKEELERETTELEEAFVVLWDSALGICEPRLLGFLVLFSGFWAMFYQLFDMLPNYITDWVDGRAVAQALAAPLLELFGQGLPADWNGHLPQEHMININAGMCMLFAFVVGYYMGKVRSMVAMIAGMAVASFAIWCLGLSTNGWVIMLVIASFSMGELMASPTKMRYFSSLAPKGKKGLYLGYINATVGIGWALGSVIAGKMYEEGGDKVVLARRYLIEQLDHGTDAVAAMKKTEVIPALAKHIGKDAEAVRELLFAHYDPSFVWTHFALIGVVSMVGLVVYDRITRSELSFKLESALILAVTTGLAWWTYGMKPGLTFGGCICLYLIYNEFAPDLLPGGAEDEDEDEAEAEA